MLRRRQLAIAVVIASVVAAACSADSVNKAASPSERAVSAQEGVHFLIDYLQARYHSAQRTADWHRTADELLPNVEYRRSDGGSQTVTSLTVVGRIARVDQGKGFVVAGEDAPGGVPVPFESPKAKWCSIEATVQVDRAIGSAKSPAEVRFALPLDEASDFERAAAGLEGLGRVVLFLYKHPVWDYDDSLYSVYQESYIATVAGDGTLALPVMEPERASKLLAGTPKLVDLEERGRRPRRTIPLASSGGVDERP